MNINVVLCDGEGANYRVVNTVEDQSYLSMTQGSLEWIETHHWLPSSVQSADLGDYAQMPR